MTDLTGLTLTMDRPTTTAPALIAWNAKKAAERAANDERKAAQARYFRELERAAIESQTRPIKTPKVKAPGEPKPPREKKQKTPKVRAVRIPKPPRPKVDPIRPCAGTCGRLTRARQTPASTAPGTVARARNDTCSACLSGPPKPSRAPLVDVAILAADYATGMSLGDVARLHRIGRTTARGYLREAGVPIRQQGVTNPDLETGRAHPAIRPCAGGCGRLTKPRNNKYDHPDAVTRKKEGKCTRCITGGTKHTPKVDPEVLAAEYTAGMSLGQISAKHGVAKTTAAHHIRRAGVTMRPAPVSLARKGTAA